MPANEALVLKEPGSALTFKATAAITGKRFLKISGNRTGGGMGGLSADLANVYQMAQCVADNESVGVSAYDVASGAIGKCITGPGTIVTVTSGAAVTAGAAVKSDANGKAIAWATAGARLGIALTGVGAADADLEVMLSDGTL